MSLIEWIYKTRVRPRVFAMSANDPEDCPFERSCVLSSVRRFHFSQGCGRGRSLDSQGGGVSRANGTLLPFCLRNLHFV